MKQVTTQPLTPAAFAPFGEVLSAEGTPDMIINGGKCGRHHDLAALDFGEGKAGISIFNATPYALPLKLEMVERHPLGSQAFLPLSADPFLVVVAPDQGSKPGEPLAFLTQPGMGVNYRRGTWHGVVTPLVAQQFAVVDRIGEGDNLEEHWFDAPYLILNGDA